MDPDSSAMSRFEDDAVKVDKPVEDAQAPLDGGDGKDLGTPSEGAEEKSSPSEELHREVGGPTEGTGSDDKKEAAKSEEKADEKKSDKKTDEKKSEKKADKNKKQKKKKDKSLSETEDEEDEDHEDKDKKKMEKGIAKLRKKLDKLDSKMAALLTKKADCLKRLDTVLEAKRIETEVASKKLQMECELHSKLLAEGNGKVRLIPCSDQLTA